MNLMHIFTDIPIMIVIITFISSTIFCIKKYIFVNKNLVFLYNFLRNFNKNDLNFRFKEIDEWMNVNPYVSATWREFKNTLIFSESPNVTYGRFLALIFIIAKSMFESDHTTFAV